MNSFLPAISIAPQKDTSPSPCDMCMSPILRRAPGTKTGNQTVHPLDRFLMSQFPPFSLPGTVRAPSLAILSHTSQLPPFSRKCPSFPSMAPLGSGRHLNNEIIRQIRARIRNNSLRYKINRPLTARGRVERQPHNVFSIGVPSSATREASRSFQILSSSALWSKVGSKAVSHTKAT
jgi:hypothetical protein